MDRLRMERCLDQVAAYKASGQKASIWAAANGVALKELSSWCAHAARWQLRLQGVAQPVSRPVSQPVSRPVNGFVAATLPTNMAATVRIELDVGSTRLELHWPLTHGRELALWLHALGR